MKEEIDAHIATHDLQESDELEESFDDSVKTDRANCSDLQQVDASEDSKAYAFVRKEMLITLDRN